jgi:hypothetical protein
MDTHKVWELFEKSGFFTSMRERLRKHEHKHRNEETIKDLNEDQLVDHLLTEIRELESALKTGSIADEQQELSDVANMCGFVFAKNNEKRKSDNSPVPDLGELFT